MKKKIIWSVAAVAAAALITIGILFACGVFTPSNGKKYDVSSCIMQENSPLRGKTIYWLGSSVTLGMASEEQAVADFLQATTGCISRPLHQAGARGDPQRRPERVYRRRRPRRMDEVAL